MSTFTVSIEVGGDGWATAWVAELPGLFVNQATERAARRALAESIAAYLRWLWRHGEPARVVRAPKVAVAARHQIRGRLRWGGYAVLHEFERPPVTRREVAQVLRWMGYMRRDTLSLISRLPLGGLEWTRPGQERTIARHLRHIAGAERWYLTRLGLGPFPDLGRTTDPVERLARVRRMAVARLRRLTAVERARIIKIEHEWWSARKMLGRFLYHERYHLRSMARIARHHGRKVPPGLGGWPRY